MGQSKPFHAVAVVVEDDEIQREMLTLLLEESNFEVIQCEDAETAALAVQIRHPALLITDVNLTGRMTGIELAHLARAQDEGMRIIVISGDPPSASLPDGARFLSKPFYPTTVLQETMH
jgi:DNA-binding response OmpR family regulator